MNSNKLLFPVLYDYLKCSEIMFIMNEPQKHHQSHSAVKDEKPLCSETASAHYLKSTGKIWFQCAELEEYIYNKYWIQKFELHLLEVLNIRLK